MSQPAPLPADDRLIVALDVPNVVQGLEIARRLGDQVSFYKIGLGMLTGGGLALANEMKQEMGKRIFLDMKFFDIPATVEAAVRGIARFDLDFLTVHGDPHVVRAAREGAAGSGLKILAVTVLTAMDRADLDASMIVPGEMADIVTERADRAFAAGADGVIASPHEAARIRALPSAAGRLIVTPGSGLPARRRTTRNASPPRPTRCARAPTTSSSAARSGTPRTRPPPPAPSSRNWRAPDRDEGFALAARCRGRLGRPAARRAAAPKKGAVCPPLPCGHSPPRIFEERRWGLMPP
ncbi:hypothetical protein MASR1M49_39210 [Pararhodobacter aggregans]